MLNQVGSQLVIDYQCDWKGKKGNGKGRRNDNKMEKKPGSRNKTKKIKQKLEE
jgi:hypothetical protein